jgi:hypothetical protein
MGIELKGRPDIGNQRRRFASDGALVEVEMDPVEVRY